jgi:hypothetical protein
MNEFLKQPPNLLLHWKKWPRWQLFSHTILLYTSLSDVTQPPVNRHYRLLRLVPSVWLATVARNLCPDGIS